jgi:subtilase family serine protease
MGDSQNMKKGIFSFRIISSLLVIITLVGVAFGVLYFRTNHAAHAASNYNPHPVTIKPIYQKVGVVPSAPVFSCQTTNPAGCYGPQQIRTAYGIQQVLDEGITGKGRTIVIIDAFQSPTIRNDLHVFDTLFGLPDPTLNIIAPDGLTPFDPTSADQIGWSGEITLDVEWSHAVAPGATIDLVLSKSDMDADILSATKYAIDHNLGDVISQSFGEAEQCMDPNLLKLQHQLFQEATLKHITLFASSGDQGAAQPTCDGTSYFKAVSTPASDPLVTGVGGTRLYANGLTGEYYNETVWNEPGIGASGGGFSVIYKAPFYQVGIPDIQANGFRRGVPDVAYNAAVNGGVLTVWSSSGLGQNLVFRFGGTSAGSPQWAGITTLADQAAGHRLGFLNAAFYAISKVPFLYSKLFHDITVGNNSFDGVTGYNAHPGWDPTTGLGSPQANNIVALLGQYCHPTDGNNL